MTTIRDIAKLADVSVATVSRILNKKGNVAPQTKAKVEKAIAATNYVPNQVARNLYKKSSKMIGIIVPYLKNEFYAEIIDGIQSVLQPAGYTAVISFDAGSDAKKYKQFIKNFEQNNIDGIITSAFTANDENIAKVPLIMYDSANIDDAIIRIASDNRAGGKACVNLLRPGTQHVLIQHMPLNLPTVRERIEAIIEALNQKNIGYTLFEAKTDDTTNEARKILNFIPNYDAIISINDLYAAEIIKLAHKRHLKLPDELQVIGYDNSPLSSYTTPTISTIDQHPERIGKTAATRLLSLIDGQKSTLNSVIPITQIKRQSTD